MAISVNTHNRSGFTLIELMIVIMILGGLMAMLLPGINNALKSAKKSNARTMIMNLKSGIVRFQGVLNKYPTKLSDLTKRPKSGDEKITKKWDGPYYGDEEGVDIPEDPWGENYHYKLNQPGTNHPYELYSYGPNGKGSPKEEWISVWD